VSFALSHREPWDWRNQNDRWIRLTVSHPNRQFRLEEMANRRIEPKIDRFFPKA
jgi:hypothetical protein